MRPHLMTIGLLQRWHWGQYALRGAGVVVFGWAVRAAAASLLALYTLGLTGVTRSPPGAG